MHEIIQIEAKNRKNKKNSEESKKKAKMNETAYKRRKKAVNKIALIHRHTWKICSIYFLLSIFPISVTFKLLVLLFFNAIIFVVFAIIIIIIILSLPPFSSHSVIHCLYTFCSA